MQRLINEVVQDSMAGDRHRYSSLAIRNRYAVADEAIHFHMIDGRNAWTYEATYRAAWNALMRYEGNAVLVY